MYGASRSNNARTTTYYVHNDDSVYVDGDYYDAENLPNYIVYCEANGEYLHKDNAWYCETDGEWYPEDHADLVRIDGLYYRDDDDDIVECKDGKHRLKDNCWESADGNWYSDDETQIEVTGGTYHPDELQDMIDNA